MNLSMSPRHSGKRKLGNANFHNASTNDEQNSPPVHIFSSSMQPFLLPARKLSRGHKSEASSAVHERKQDAHAKSPASIGRNKMRQEKECNFVHKVTLSTNK